jgi:hypothetical protein
MVLSVWRRDKMMASDEVGYRLVLANSLPHSKRRAK